MFVCSGFSIEEGAVMEELESHFRALMAQAIEWLHHKVQGGSPVDVDSSEEDGNRPESLSQRDDSSSSSEEDEDEECQMMPCVRVMVTYQKGNQIGQGLLHPTLEDQRQLPMVSYHTL